MNWRRVMVILAAGVAGLVLVVGGGVASIFAGLVPIEDGLVIGPLTTVKDGYVAAFVGEAPDGSVYLIDAGNDAAGAALLAALAAKGKSAADVRALFITHGHPDHIAACALFPNAEVIALAAEAPLIAGEVAAKGPIPRLVKNDAGCRVTRPVADLEAVEIGGATLTPYALPGHTAGSAAWLVDGVLLLGDAASATTSGTIRGGPYVFNDDTPRTDETLQALAARLPPGVEWLVPSHSGPLAGVAALEAFRPR